MILEVLGESTLPIRWLSVFVEGRGDRGPGPSPRRIYRAGWLLYTLADDLKHERKVALKVLKPELAAVVGAEHFLAAIKT